MTEKIFTPQEALTNALEIKKERYSDAEFCIAAGSIITGNGAAYSDLDLIVIHQKLETAYRESFLYNAMPVEAFVHDYETIQAFIDGEYKDADSTTLHMITTGIIIPEGNASALKLRSYADRLIKKGPEAINAAKHESLRYSITDLIDDLRGKRPQEEYRAILYKLYPMIGELALRYNRIFESSGKHLVRKLKQYLPELFNDLETIMLSSHTEDLKKEHIEKLEELMKPLGGLLFDGYRQNAPTDKRAEARWLNE
jgi:hypothetical protein